LPKKVLIITYYWPPAGGSGVQRWLKFSKYLRGFGWEPIIYTVKNPEISATDHSLEKDVPENLTILRKKAFEPYQLFKILTRRRENLGVGFTSQENNKHSIISKISIWIRGNFFIPDARMLWIKPSVKYLSKYLTTNAVGAIVSTGPPHSTHLIGYKLSVKHRIPWIADFRDPWTNIDFFEDLMLQRSSRNKHLQLEKKVVESASAVVVVTPEMKKDFRNYSPKHIKVITNGYDADDFPSKAVETDKKFTITHVGSIPPSRNNIKLWRALGEMVKNNADFAKMLSIQLIGNIDASVLLSIAESKLTPLCQRFGYLSHQQSIDLMRRSQVLVLLINNSPNAKGILTGKLFEYLASRRPILAIGPKGGDVDMILKETCAGIFAEGENYQEILNALHQLWADYQNSFQNYSPKNIDIYSRQYLTYRLAELLKEVTC
jgi:glycosyltransferase involved in cell wall biosynthesis